MAVLHPLRLLFPTEIFLFSSLLLLFCTSCNHNSGDSDTKDITLRALIEQAGLNGDPFLERDVPDISSPKAQLGKKLFFTKSLSGNNDVACATCHHPLLGGTDQIPLSRGVKPVDSDVLGPNRLLLEETTEKENGGPKVPRNAPTTFNIAMWDSVIFHDGRIESLSKDPFLEGAGINGIRSPDSAFGEADVHAGSNLATSQAGFPVTSADEMRGDFMPFSSNEELRTALLDRLLSNDSWKQELEAVYGSDTTFEFLHITSALAEYERSQVFTRSRWTHYVEGDNSALSEEEKRGALLFFSKETEGGFDCARCHAGDKFTDESFHNIAAPQIGHGKGDSVDGIDAADFGRFRETGKEEDRYAFRTPSLLNLAVTGPYTRTGSFNSLRETVEHHLNPKESLTRYKLEDCGDNAVKAPFWKQVSQMALDHLEKMRRDGNSSLPQGLSFSEQDIDDVLSFLHSLNDPCVFEHECLTPWTFEDTDPALERFNLLRARFK